MNGEIVAPPDAGAEKADIGAVNVERDRQFPPGVFDMMNVARRNQSGDGPDWVSSVAGDNEMRIGRTPFQAINRFVFRAAVDADDTPGNMVVNGRGLARKPDQRNDGKTPIGFNVQDVLAIGFLAGNQLLAGQEIVRAQTGSEQIGHERPDASRTIFRTDRAANGSDQVQ